MYATVGVELRAADEEVAVRVASIVHALRGAAALDRQRLAKAMVNPTFRALTPKRSGLRK